MDKSATIYICGNPLLDFDSLPLKCLADLEKKLPLVKFQVLDPNENLRPVDKKLMLIDTALGIDRVILITDIKAIEIDQPYSLHDLDLAFNLRLLFELGELKQIKIFAVPPKMNYDEGLKQLLALIKKTIGID